MDWGTETELLADALRVLSLCAAGSFVRTEPELVSVEGDVKSALGGVKPSTGIVGSRKAKTTPHTTTPMLRAAQSLPKV